MYDYMDPAFDCRWCGWPTKKGKPRRAHSELREQDGEIVVIGCYLHDPRRRPRSRV